MEKKNPGVEVLSGDTALVEFFFVVVTFIFSELSLTN